MEKRLIAVLAVSLGGALLVIAFLIGRTTGAKSIPALPSAVSVPTTPASTVAEPEAAHDPLPLLVAPPATPQADRPARTAVEPQPFSRPQVGAVSEPRVQQSAETAAIASYFAKMDAIQVEGSGDPTTFAQGILDGLEHGDSTGMDKLVDSAKLSLAQASAVQPPPSCAEYHRRLLDALSEAAAGVVRMRDAISKSDADGIAALVPQIQATQQKIEDLDRMKKQLLGQSP